MKRTYGKGGVFAAHTALDNALESIQASLNQQALRNPSLTKVALGLEGYTDSDVALTNQVFDQVQVAVESIAGTLGKAIGNGFQYTPAQMEAASHAAVLSADPRSAYKKSAAINQVSTESMAVIPAMGILDAVDARPSLEAYDESANRSLAAYSMAYNLQAARQDEFGETFFPTLVVSPENTGFAITVSMMTVYDELTRSTSGALDLYNKKNIIRAYADYTILKNDSTRAVPVVRPNSVDKFVDASLIAPTNFSLEGQIIPTAPLRIGTEFSLIALCQPDVILNAGQMDMTDSLDPSIELSSVYVKVGKDVFQIKTTNLPYAFFAPSVQQNYKMMQLNFDTTSALLRAESKNVDGSDFQDLAAIKTNDLIVRLKLSLSGRVNIELGDTVVYGNKVGVFSVQNSNGDTLDLGSGVGKAVVDAFKNSEVIGYDLIAYRSNVNKRQRGQFIDTTRFTQLYTVPLRAPITALHPVTQDGQNDSSDLATLIATTRIRTSNAAVTTLIQAASLLSEYVDARDAAGAGPDVMGVGRYYIRPVFFKDTIDVAQLVNSLTSVDRYENIQAAIVNKVRDYVFRMYRDSEYQAAANTLSGGVAPTPKVIIGTDPVIARYLMVTGDLRTMGGNFESVVVSTLDKRVKGKIFVAFGVFDENRNTAPNALNFGNMAWSPELTVVLPVSRGNQISKELSVSPRFSHLVHCPIMTVIDIEDIEGALEKASLNIVNVTPKP